MRGWRAEGWERFGQYHVRVWEGDAVDACFLLGNFELMTLNY